jgi:hypothetical protein
MPQCQNPGALNPPLTPHYNGKVGHAHLISKDMECITKISTPHLTSLDPQAFSALSKPKVPYLCHYFDVHDVPPQLCPICVIHRLTAMCFC